MCKQKQASGTRASTSIPAEAKSGGNRVKRARAVGPRGSSVWGKKGPPPQVVGILIHHTSASPVLPAGASRGGFKVHEMEGGCLRKAPCQRGGMSPGGLMVKWKKEGSKDLRKIKL